MKYPGIRHVDDVYHSATRELVDINGTWEQVRPLGYPSFWHRCKAAWLVFTGKADALIYTGQ